MTAASGKDLQAPGRALGRAFIFRIADLPAAGESKIESVQCPELALVRCERCHVVRDSKRIAAYALWKTRRFALAANLRLSVHFVQIEADFNI